VERTFLSPSKTEKIDRSKGRTTSVRSAFQERQTMAWGIWLNGRAGQKKVEENRLREVEKEGE